MSRKVIVRMMVVLLILSFGSTLLVSRASAAEVLRMSSSAQVYDAYVKEAIPAFQEQTGIQVDVFISSSASSIGRLMNGMCDLATTVEGFKFRYGEYGYLEIPFCKDPLVVITHPDVPVDSITSDQVMGIFSGDIKKWKELGGPNERIIIVVPGDSTAAYKNFDRQAMGRRTIRLRLHELHIHPGGEGGSEGPLFHLLHGPGRDCRSAGHQDAQDRRHGRLERRATLTIRSSRLPLRAIRSALRRSSSISRSRRRGKRLS